MRMAVLRPPISIINIFHVPCRHWERAELLVRIGRYRRLSSYMNIPAPCCYLIAILSDTSNKRENDVLGHSQGPIVGLYPSLQAAPLQFKALPRTDDLQISE